VFEITSGFGLFPLVIAIRLSRHDNSRFDPVEAPQQRMGRAGFPAPARGASLYFRLNRV